METWKLYNKNIDFNKKMEQDETCIFLQNIRKPHFDIVVELIDNSKKIDSKRRISESSGQSTVLVAVNQVEPRDWDTKKHLKTKQVPNSCKKDRDPDWIPSQNVTKRKVTTENNPPQKRSCILQLSTSTDSMYLQPSTSTHPKYLQPSTSMDIKYLQPSTSMDIKYLQPSTSMDIKYLQPSTSMDIKYLHPSTSMDLKYLLSSTSTNPRYLQPLTSANLGDQSSATSADRSDTLSSSHERINNFLSSQVMMKTFSSQYIRFICEGQKKFPEIERIVQPVKIFKKLKYLIQWKQNSPEDEIDGEILDADIVHELWPDLLAKFYIDLHLQKLMLA